VGGGNVAGGGGAVEGGSYQFDPVWWNNYVVKPGVVGWSNTSGIAGPAGPPPPEVSIDQPMPLSIAANAMEKVLDGMGVESHWLANQEVNWATGEASNTGIKSTAINGGAFVAAVCKKFKLSIPASGAEDFNPGNQIDWFMNVGKEKGWIKVGEAESQVLANQGWVVVAAWQNMAEAGKRENSGQLAIVRPDREPVSALAERGPLVAMAGPHNHNSIGVKDGFPAGAWSKQEVVYLAHRPGK
jgi:hypothetical protein